MNLPPTDLKPPLRIYNSLTREKDVFQPIDPPYVGLYVCGPTVYSDVHLGNCRTFTSFDIVYRYLTHLGYKVRYVRNITDVGHLTDDGDDGEDKIAKRARLEKLEPMELVQKYANGFHEVMRILGNFSPSIEPQATGHIVEQIEMVKTLLSNGLAYESNGSVYFDVDAYNAKGLDGQQYGALSGRNLDDLLEGTRRLDGQSDKRKPYDFAIWKKAAPEHIMRWPSPWGDGFPGWHLECSVMSSKYLGPRFDIHGGGMDLRFPHHECEIAQGTGANGQAPVNYWMHANMLTVNGQKMSKSLGNSILPHDLFRGSHELLDQAYSPMTLRFFMLQTHYRSTMDISVEALQASKKAYFKLMNGLRAAKALEYVPDESVAVSDKAEKQIVQIVDSIYRGMNDDFNTAQALAGVFNLLKKVNSVHNGAQPSAQYTPETFEYMKTAFVTVVEDVLGLQEEPPVNLESALDTALNAYREAKAARDYDKVDLLRADFKKMGLVLKDLKDRVEWAYEE